MRFQIGVSLKILTSQAPLAVAANLTDVSKANDVADLVASHGRADLLDSSDTLMSQSNVGVSEVKVGAANTRVRYLDEDVVRAKLPSDGLADRDIALSAAVGIKGNLCAHFEVCGMMCGLYKRVVDEGGKSEVWRCLNDLSDAVLVD